MKLLWFDRSGDAMLFKRLERGTFQLPPMPAGQARVRADAAMLAMIFAGIDLRRALRRARHVPSEPADDEKPEL
jgi:hypothetical protein